MRLLILTAICFVTLSFQAQDWHLVRSESQLNYRLDTADFISQTVSVKAVEVLNGDSIFQLNRIVEDCPECTTNGSEFPCWNEEFVVLNRPSILGLEVLSTDTGFHLVDEETWYFPKDLSVGESWELKDGCTAQLGYVTSGTTFSTSDSVRNITTDNGEIIQWSKAFGLLQFPDWSTDQNWILTGVKGPDVGEHLPGFEDVFHWEVGDVFYFQGRNGSSWDNHDHEQRREVLTVNLYPDSVVYELKIASRTWHDQLDQYDTPWEYSGVHYVTESYHRSNWNVLDLNADELMTGNDYLPDHTSSDPWGFANYMAVFDSDYNTALRVNKSLNRYLISEGKLAQEGSFPDNGWPVTNQSVPNEVMGMGSGESLGESLESDTLCHIQEFDGDLSHVSFAEGLGIVYCGEGDGLSGQHIAMVAFSTSSGSYGDVPECSDIVSSIDGPNQDHGIDLVQHGSQITLFSREAHYGNWIIVYSSRGQLIEEVVMNGKTTLNTEDWSTGIYIVTIPELGWKEKVIVAK